MSASAPFTGFYSKAMRSLLPCLSGQELKLFVAIATYTDEQGKCYPGVRQLSDVTTFPEKVISDLLTDLDAKGLVLTIRKMQRDPLTGRMMPDVYIVNPEILLISDLSLWIEIRLRNVSIPESTFPLKSVQADRITEADTVEAESAKQNHSPEGAAMLFPDLMSSLAAKFANTAGKDGGTHSAASSANAQNSTAQPRISPGSAAPPSVRPLSFNENLAVNAIKRQVPD